MTEGTEVASAAKVRAAADVLRRLGRRRIGILLTEKPHADVRSTVDGVEGLEPVVVSKTGDVAWDGRTVSRLSIATASRSDAVDAVLIIENKQMPELMRAAEPLFQTGIVVMPADVATVVPEWMLKAGRYDVVWNWAPVEYAARSGLKGHYLEFGTFWGRSFFLAYHFLRDWMEGDFYAFDSFAGLSAPTKQETQFTVGDFTAGAYACNQASFEAIASLVEMDARRLKIVKGFYSETLSRPPSDHGLKPGSVSICAIDCDLFDPTLQALEFVRPLLEPGALLYFDDWRLCRASPKVGERAAALEWLRRHPEIELVEFYSSHWQHQWFIYHGGDDAEKSVWLKRWR